MSSLRHLAPSDLRAHRAECRVSASDASPSALTQVKPIWRVRRRP